MQPLIGRLFTEADDRGGAAGTTLLSYRLWQTRFGGDPSIVGQQVMLDNESYTVIGVMPREFRFPSSEAQLWTPLRFTEENYVDRSDNWMYAVGRLRPGVTLEQARAEMELIAAQSQAAVSQGEREHQRVGHPVQRRSVAAVAAAALRALRRGRRACC